MCRWFKGYKFVLGLLIKKMIYFLPFINAFFTQKFTIFKSALFFITLLCGGVKWRPCTRVSCSLSKNSQQTVTKCQISKTEKKLRRFIKSHLITINPRLARPPIRSWRWLARLEILGAPQM